MEFKEKETFTTVEREPSSGREAVESSFDNKDFNTKINSDQKEVQKLQKKLYHFKDIEKQNKKSFEVEGGKSKFLKSVKEIMPAGKESAFDFTKKDFDYIQKYRKHQLRETETNLQHFVLTPRHRKEIVDLLPEITENLHNELIVTDEIVAKWPQSTISAILSKGLVLESIKYSRHIGESVSRLLKDSSLSQKDSLKICELCVGTGITSSHLWFELKNTLPNKKAQIHAVDNSIESIAASICLFEVQKVPYLVLKDAKNLSEVPEDFEGVVLIATDALEFLESHKSDDKSYDASVSENGISYFTSEKHEKSIDLMANATNSEGVLAISSLNPDFTVNLDKKFLFKEIIKGGDKYEKYSEMIEKGIKQYEVQDGEIKKAITKETGGQIELLNNLLKTDITTFSSYMKGLISATKAAKVLVNEMKSPVNKTKEYVDLKYPTWESVDEDWNIDGAPCNVLILKI